MPERLAAQFAEVAVGGASLGGGFVTLRWFFNFIAARHDRRQAVLDAKQEKLDAEHEALDGGWAQYRRKLERRIEQLEVAAEARDGQMMAMRLAFELVGAELRKADPNNGALRRAEQLLVRAFPLTDVISTQVASRATVDGLDDLPETSR
jgi:hypothetical protein